jgi:hypothetical protein
MRQLPLYAPALIFLVTIKKEKGTSEKLRRATILLKSDVNGPAWGDIKIS